MVHEPARALVFAWSGPILMEVRPTGSEGSQSAAMPEKATSTEIFITGGSGYIGGTVLHLMVSRGDLERFGVSALVRKRSDAETMHRMGIRPVLGSLDDLETLRREAARADVVINNANCDHQESAIAIVQGLLERSTRVSRKPILIHTSGAGVLSTNSTGTGAAPSADPTATLWDEADAAAHAAIPSSAPHRHVDLEIFRGAATGLIKTYLMVPPTVFGVGLGPLAERRMSIQIPRLVHRALIRRRAQFVGQGRNVWPNVHVADLAELYLILLDAAFVDRAPEGTRGLYYPATEHFEWNAVSGRIGELLAKRGLLRDPTATTGLEPGWFWGSNVRLVPTNSTSLGWQPVRGGTAEMLADIEHDIELVLTMVIR